jgi:hypothetical protein
MPEDLHEVTTWIEVGKVADHHLPARLHHLQQHAKKMNKEPV